MTEAERIRDYFETAHWRPSAGRRHLLSERFDILTSIAGTLPKEIGELAICDVGCGRGADLVNWRNAGVVEAQLAGTELVPARARTAMAALPDADIKVVSDFALPFSAAAFDLCTASLVLSTITEPANRRRLLMEMVRVTRPGGAIVVYDFAIRKPWNRNVTAISAGSLRAMWRAPDETYRAAPFLPALDLVLRLPQRAATGLIAMLPRTHRAWVWRLESRGESDSAAARSETPRPK